MGFIHSFNRYLLNTRYWSYSILNKAYNPPPSCRIRPSGNLDEIRCRQLPRTDWNLQRPEQDSPPTAKKTLQNCWSIKCLLGVPACDQTWPPAPQTHMAAGLHHGVPGLYALLPLWAPSSIKKIIKIIFYDCWYEKEHYSGWIILQFVFWFWKKLNIFMGP